MHSGACPNNPHTWRSNDLLEAETVGLIDQSTAQDAPSAGTDWDNGDVDYNDLPDSIKADWVHAYAKRVARSDGSLTNADFDQLRIDQQNIERDYYAYADRQSEQTTPRALPSSEGRSSVSGSSTVAQRVQAEREETSRGEVTDAVDNNAQRTAPAGQTLTAAEREMVIFSASDLSMPQSRKLEAAYNAETGTADFNQQLQRDVEAFMEGGVAAVNPKIASIVQSLAPEVPGLPINRDVTKFRKLKTKLPGTPPSLKETNDTVERIARRIGGRVALKVENTPVGSSSVSKGETRPNGDIVIYADQVESKLDLLRTVFHELLHRGVQTLFRSNSAYVKSMLDLVVSAYLSMCFMKPGTWSFSVPKESQR
jgi:hypothetical protein